VTYLSDLFFRFAKKYFIITPEVAVRGTENSMPIKPNKAPKKNIPNIIQTG
jgi:hypothetical protein